MMVDLNDVSSETEQKNASGLLDPRLLEMLVCPVSKTCLVYNPSTKELCSPNAHLAYPVRDGIPIMIIEEARQIAD